MPLPERHMTRAALSLDRADAHRIIAAGERKAVEIGVARTAASGF
jgi:hypothetical protein